MNINPRRPAWLLTILKPPLLSPGNRFRYGCPQTVAWWLEPWTSTLAGISLGFCLLDLLVVGITFRVRTYIRMVKEN